MAMVLGAVHLSFLHLLLLNLLMKLSQELWHAGYVVNFIIMWSKTSQVLGLLIDDQVFVQRVDGVEVDDEEGEDERYDARNNTVGSRLSWTIYIYYWILLMVFENGTCYEFLEEYREVLAEAPDGYE